MSRSFGLVGLPNAGKSTVFNALTDGGARVEAYPFCTIEPHRGIVGVPDDRLERLHSLYPDKRMVPTTVEVVDIAGLVSGAAHGEGLGNQFLAEIRACDAILHIVRCFADEQVAHPAGTVDVKRDVEMVEMELLLKDLDTLERRQQRTAKVARTGDRGAREEMESLERLITSVKQGVPLRELSLSPQEETRLKDLAPLTAKPILYVANVGEEGVNEHLRALSSLAQQRSAPCIAIRGRLEAEVAETAQGPEEYDAFLQEWGIERSALEELLQAAYGLLNLVTFYTVEGPEVRAWTVVEGTQAPEAGGVIHGDFRERFVVAEVMDLEELIAVGGERALRQEGRIIRAGRDYIVQDADVIHFICA